MLDQVLVGAALIIITIFIHAAGMSAALRFLTKAHQKQLHQSSFWIRSLIVAAFVLILFTATLLEAGVWAATYRVLGAISDYEEAVYFSLVTYTTLGYGDVVLDGQWRLLSGIEAANGLIIFSWTTALIVLALRRISRVIQQFATTD